MDKIVVKEIFLKKVKGKGRPKIDKSNRFEDYNKLNGSKSC